MNTRLMLQPAAPGPACWRRAAVWPWAAWPGKGASETQWGKGPGPTELTNPPRGNKTARRAAPACRPVCGCPVRGQPGWGPPSA